MAARHLPLVVPLETGTLHIHVHAAPTVDQSKHDVLLGSSSAGVHADQGLSNGLVAKT